MMDGHIIKGRGRDLHFQTNVINECGDEEKKKQAVICGATRPDIFGTISVFSRPGLSLAMYALSIH